MELHAVAAALAAARLLHLGIAKRQLALLVYLISTVIGNLVLSHAPLNSRAYFWGYLFFQTWALITEIAVVRELFSLSMEGYPGIRTAARWTMYGAVTLAGLTSLVMTAASWGGRANGTSHLFYVLQLNRSVQFSLAVFIISLLVFLSRYPLRLHWNIYVSIYFFSAVFLVEAVQNLIASMSLHLFSKQVDLAVVLVMTVLFLGWAFMLRPQDSVARNVSFETAGEHELLLQLESLNSTLSRAGRRH